MWLAVMFALSSTAGNELNDSNNFVTLITEVGSYHTTCLRKHVDSHYTLTHFLAHIYKHSSQTYTHRHSLTFPPITCSAPLH